MKNIFPMILASMILTSCGSGQTGSGDSSNASESEETEGSSIRFDISDAVGILKIDPDSTQVIKIVSSAGNIYKLTTSGNVKEVFTGDESVRASTLYIAPDGRLYIVFESSVLINKRPCFFLRLSKDNTGQCVDDTLTMIDTFAAPTQPIQFDGEGNIYYAGQSSDGKGVLRKKTAELNDAKNLINDDIRLTNFLVKEDGTVYISGVNNSTDTRFFRRILNTGELENLLNGADILSLYELPDKNVYAGDFGLRFGVMKITDQGISDTLYIGDSSAYVTDFDCDNNTLDSCIPANFNRYESFCGVNGTMLSYYYRSPDDHVYVVTGSGEKASLWQYWPDVQPTDTSVYRPTIVRGTMTTLLIAGYDEAQKNKLISYNTADKSEIDLLNGENIEIYHFSYSAGSGRIIFDGLRFSDNTYIVGLIDTQNSNALTVLETGTHYEDVQFFE